MGNEIQVKMIKELVTKDGKRFHVGDDIAFRRWNSAIAYRDMVICRIVEIHHSCIIADKVEINRCNQTGRSIFTFKTMQDVNYVRKETENGK